MSKSGKTQKKIKQKKKIPDKPRKKSPETLHLLHCCYWPSMYFPLPAISMCRLPLRDVDPNFQIKYQMWKYDKNKHQAEWQLNFYLSISKADSVKMDCFMPRTLLLLWSIRIGPFSRPSNIPHFVVSSPFENRGAFPPPVTCQSDLKGFSVTGR